VCVSFADASQQFADASQQFADASEQFADASEQFADASEHVADASPACRMRFSWKSERRVDPAAPEQLGLLEGLC